MTRITLRVRGSTITRWLRADTGGKTKFRLWETYALATSWFAIISSARTSAE
jgi:hypothetical protein